MFGNKKRQAKRKKANERLVRKVLGKQDGRKVFGFRCVPWLKTRMKNLAAQLHVDEYALSEHAFELGLIQVDHAMADPENREELRSHLTGVHVENRVIENISRYDQEASDELADEHDRRLSIDRGVRRIVVKFSGRVNPDDLDEVIDFGLRAMQDLAAGHPASPAVSRSPYLRRR